jgi:ubiquinone/menaquinone biosynthesis C-methylase UbiE
VLSEYKRKQMEHEDRNRPKYNLQPVEWSPIQKFYAEYEYSRGLKLIQDLLPLESIRTLLLCGVGAGSDLHYWLTHLSMEAVLGLELSREAIQATQRRVALNCLPEITKYIQGDFENISLNKDVVDFGVFVHSLHHAQDPEQAFKELWRVSRKGVLVIEPLSTSVTRFFSSIGLAQDWEPAGNKVIRFTPEQFVEWTDGFCAAYRSKTSLHYYHPLITRNILTFCDKVMKVETFEFLYSLANIILVPIHSKFCTVLIKK